MKNIIKLDLSPDGARETRELNGWLSAIFGGVILSIVGTALHYFLI